MIRFALAAALVLLAIPALAQPLPKLIRRPPNIVIMFCDDLGYGDVLGHARGYETPNLERMAAEGMRFTSFYAAQPVCSASRTGLLTGCYPNRIGIQGALGPNDMHGIHADETTLAEVCKARGYATAIYGKWHLGHREPFLPTNHGFDEFIGIPYSNDMWPRHPDMTEEQRLRKQGYPDLPLYHNNTIINHDITIEDQRQFTRYFTERAVQFIEEHAAEPFFVYIPHPMPHVPIYASEAWAGRTGRGLYADVIGEIDWSIGRVNDTIDRLGLRENTLIIFTSDNGPWLSYGNRSGSAGPLREGKGTTWEGGVRVPCVMRWPGTIPAGRACDEPVMTIDILPTVREILFHQFNPGVIPMEELLASQRALDGMSILPLMRDDPDAKSPHEVLYFYYHDNNLEALRSGKWKLYLPHRYRTMIGSTPGKDGLPGPYTQIDMGVELYDLDADLGETTDLAPEHPEVVERLMQYAEAAREDLGDKLTDRPGKNRREPGRWAPPEE
jgi:arylsulfatase A